MALRQPVRVTYAHKRGRAQATNQLPSSPLEPLDPDREDVTRSEMARRMLKRSRRVANAEQAVDNTSNRPRARERITKKSRRSEPIAQLTDPNIMTMDDLLPADASSFQTPFPASDYVNSSSLTRPMVPEALSPVPVARRILSRTSSRNLKENGRTSRPLASPFHSRPGSTAPSPRSKGQTAKGPRAPLHAKSRTLSGAFEENGTRRTSRKDSSVSLHNSSKNSPAKSTMHHRYPSNPTPSYMLQHVTQQEWMVPPKALSRPSAAAVRTPPHASPTSTQSSVSFLGDRPQFYSTPLQHRMGSRTGLAAPDVSPAIFGAVERVDQPTADDDVEMADARKAQHRQVAHIKARPMKLEIPLCPKIKRPMFSLPANRRTHRHFAA
ncbi:hypothetical protein BV22DRAFT_1120376 [Leucogyrophana mollusca]|uniref:Uncharacterized protein n=1 Tax=Leucogyrophana mollusca TaxID=85980 RepID=A0ACB8BEH7_9AGAM|nr:hypothetical protein BV22DRAFT_1120376 [Leucogyrophana mollusca]